MSEEYKEFNATDYVKTDADVRELLRAATDEDVGDGVVIRAASQWVGGSEAFNQGWGNMGTHVIYRIQVEATGVEIRSGRD